MNNANQKFRASLSKGRSGWCVIFRHPLLDGPGNQKRRVRRGLGTREEEDAQKLVDQLNTILSSPEMWSPSQRQKLESMFDHRIVAAFMDGVEPDRYDPWGDRELQIPLPGAEQGYAKIQVVGTTGSGKTTLVRQLLGADPVTERFPSTSAAKTTVCDIEIVLAEGQFKGCVSFLPRDQARQYVADCVAACAFTFMEGGPESEAVRRLFEHPEQKFRLNYLLGPLEESTAGDDSDEDATGEEDLIVEDADEGGISAEERQKMASALRGYLDEICALADRLAETVAKGLGQPIEELTASDRDAFEELAEAELLKDDSYHEIVDKIVDDLEGRFESLDQTSLNRGRDGWPTSWVMETANRAEFIHAINRFSSNYAPLFGRLLTPLVQGIRVRGPFKPKWHDGPLPRLVLMDGQGIGHTADSTSSVSTTITKRFKLANLILLVDNAAQPLQAASCAVLSSVVASGNTQKLLVCFTHFDEVRGDNLPDVKARKNHVTGSFDNAVRAIGKTLGREAESSLKRLVPNRLLFLSGIQHVLKPENKLSRNALAGILKASEASIVPPEPDEFQPVYDVANLIIAIQRATQEFHEKWMGVLGMGGSTGIAAEHWTRIKALTRRIAYFGSDEYDNLKPVADLIQLLQKHISAYLATPLDWHPYEPRQEQEEKRQLALDTIRQKVFGMLHDLSTERIIRKHIADWVVAYDYRGTGSTRLRAKDIRAVYESGAPVPAEMPGKDANAFMLDVRILVKDAVTNSGGKVVGWDAQTGEDGK
jgi:hypothetical protein